MAPSAHHLAARGSTASSLLPWESLAGDSLHHLSEEVKSSCAFIEGKSLLLQNRYHYIVCIDNKCYSFSHSSDNTPDKQVTGPLASRCGWAQPVSTRFLRWAIFKGPSPQ